MDPLEMIRSRRTVRRFRQEPIGREILDRMVDAARLAPSAANRQPCEFLVVDDPARVAEVFPLVRWAGYIAPAGDPPEGQRPTAYILILVDTEKKMEGWAAHDAAAAAMNVIYAAAAQGIGSCWMGAIDRDSLKRLFGIPDRCAIDTLLALGYPSESPVLEPFEDSVQYWKDESGVLHVPKRALASVLHRNEY